jgi:MFS family permease
MKPREFRAAAALAAVFSVRLLGLFMIYPVFAAYAGSLAGASPYLIGEALGIYGLTQGLLQIPFGLLSDRIGRKIMIVIGLVLFGIGSAVAAVSASIGGVIIGRALQGTGAVGSVILALVADLTSEEARTAAMAMVGITIGASFLVALLAGPIVANFIGVGGIFWLMVALAALASASRSRNSWCQIRSAFACIATPRRCRRCSAPCCATANCCGSISAYSRYTPCSPRAFSSSPISCTVPWALRSTINGSSICRFCSFPSR